MVDIVRVGCGLALLAGIVEAQYQLVDPDSYDGGSYASSYGAPARDDPEVLELFPYESSNHYRYRPPRPQRVKLVKSWNPTKPSSPLQAVQKIFLSKQSPISSSTMTYSLGAVALALVSQAVGTLFLLLLAKLIIGMKAILATNTATLGLTVWNHLKKIHKKKKHKKKQGGGEFWHKPKPVKIHTFHKKKPHKHQIKLVNLSKKQVKKLIKLLKKKKTNKEW